LVPEPHQFEHHRLENILDGGKAPGHIPVECRVSARHLALVPRGQNQIAEFVRKSHEYVAPDSGLDVFLGDIFLQPQEWGRESSLVGFEKLIDTYCLDIHTEVAGKPDCIFPALAGRVDTRHEQTMHSLGSQGIYGYGGHQCRIDSSGEADQHVRESILSNIVLGPEDQCFVDFFLLRAGRNQ